MQLQQFFVEGLGHASYLLGSERTHEAIVVDPRRDIQVYVDEAHRAGLTIRYVVETHVHNDFVSGARHLARLVEAEHVASAAAGLQYPHRKVGDGDELRLGELRLRAVFTPGHTPEHMTYLLIDTSRADVPVAAFTGGNLLVGAVGRPDLLGPELGEQLAPLLYDSLHQKLLRLHDYVEVLPTHGAGSLCGKGITGKRTSTVGYERRYNPALRQQTREEFVQEVLTGNPGIPAYYQRMRPTNQAGPDEWTPPVPVPLSPGEVKRLAEQGAIILDTRSPEAFGGGHLPDAVNIGLEDSFATWVGWLLLPDVPLILVLEREEEWTRVTTALARVGYTYLAGYLDGGIRAWTTEALPLERTDQWSVHDLRPQLDVDRLQVVDVRTQDEWDDGHIRGAIHLELGDLPQRLRELDRLRPVAVTCATGYRSSAGASLLQREGFPEVANVLGGMTAWKRADYHLETEDSTYVVE